MVEIYLIDGIQEVSNCTAKFTPNKCDVTVQRVYKILEEIKETYCRTNKIKL